MYAAQNQLRFALNQLNMAMADKAGHRAQAITLVKQAMTQVSLGNHTRFVIVRTRLQAAVGTLGPA
jgi:hypothetical protein